MRGRFALIGVSLLMLAGCASRPSALDFYDNCARQNPTFVAMAECGAANRNAWCMANNSCSADGNASVLYADSLVQSVKTHELTEPEAQRRWIEYRSNEVNAARQQDLQRQAIFAADNPSSFGCIPNRYGRCF